MKLRGILLATTVAVFASSGMARAADAIVYEPAPEFVPGFTWTGAYIGIQGGYGWADLSDDGGDTFIEDISFGARNSLDLDGGFLGVYAGFNYQFDNNVVLGIEGDINKAWMDDRLPPPTPSSSDAEFELDWFASIRGRLGYAWDRTLLFATGGIAFAEVDYSVPWISLSGSESFVGWTIGAGVEHAFTDNLLARAEYRYYDFGSETFGDPATTGGDLDLDMHTISVGLGYKF